MGIAVGVLVRQLGRGRGRGRGGGRAGGREFGRYGGDEGEAVSVGEEKVGGVVSEDEHGGTEEKEARSARERAANPRPCRLK